jgi:rubrerythrin
MTTEPKSTLIKARPASSPCAMHEFEDYEPATLVPLLNELIEGERAGARGLLEMAKIHEYSDLEALLRDVAADEARFCAMLSHHVERLGGEPSRATGVFADKLAKREGLDAKIALLDKGQGAVVTMLEEMIPRIAADDLRGDLIEMRDVHRVNIDRCAAAIS